MYRKILQDCEWNVKRLLAHQIMNPDSPEYGGVFDTGDGIVCDKSGLSAMSYFTCMYLNPDSRYYKNERLYKRILLCYEFSKRKQRPDGTFDLYGCNLFSAPDTAFGMKEVCKGYDTVVKYADDDRSKALLPLYLDLIRTMADGITAGGFHTPNHRWVISAAMGQAYRILGDEKYRQTAMRYLSEGIDCNEDGEFAERSSGVYNIVNDYSLITIAECFDMPELYELVSRNLMMMIQYFEPDMTVFTHNSVRQDCGKKFYANNYFPEYLNMAYKMKNPVFFSVARQIFNEMVQRGDRLGHCIDMFMRDEELKTFSLPLVDFVQEGDFHYKNSGIVRMIRKGLTVTLLKNKPTFFFLQSGSLSLFCRIGVSYFDERHFIAEDIVEKDCEYILEYSAQSQYYLPFKEKPETSDWWQQDKSKRELLMIPAIHFRVAIRLDNGKVRMRLTTTGCDNVVFKVEMGVSADSMIKTDNTLLKAEKGQCFYLTNGELTVSDYYNTLRISGGMYRHQFVKGLPGTVARDPDSFTIYMTGRTNVDHEFCIEAQSNPL